GNQCQIATPCATFAAALTVTNPGGTINCLSPGSFGKSTSGAVLNITQQVTIDCHDAGGSFLVAPNSAAAIVIAVTATQTNPAVVTLRNLSIDGLNGSGQYGIDIQAATTVYIEDCTVSNFSPYGIYDDRTSGGATALFVKNTVLRNNEYGIFLNANGPNSVYLDNIHAVGNAYGL